MKTAQEILNKNMSIDIDSGYKIGLRDTILNSMEEYAKEVAKEALKNASENADTMEIPDAYGSTIDVVDKQSILNESNIPKLSASS